MLTILFIILACTTTEKSPAEIHEKRLWQKCVSKASGSQPECWDERDWEIFCSKVECKQ